MKSLPKRSTLLFLLKDSEILLAMKKRGFGAGRWNGVGGKSEANETIVQTAIRECQEEIGVKPVRLQHVATLNFYFPKSKSDWDQQVSVFTSYKWQGEPTETEEMKPAWFSINTIPYDAMWPDDIIWLPEILSGKLLEAEFTFDDTDAVVKHKLVIRPHLSDN